MEETHRARCGERSWSLYAFSRLPTLPASPCVHQPRSFPNPVSSGFLWRLHYKQARLIKSLAFGHQFNFQSLSPPKKSGGGTEISNPQANVGSPGNQPPSLDAFQKSSH